MTRDEMLTRLRKWALYQGLPSFTETIETALRFLDPTFESKVPGPDEYAALTHLKVLNSNLTLTDRMSAEKNLGRLYRDLKLNRKVPFSRRGHPSEFTGYRNVIHVRTKPKDLINDHNMYPGINHHYIKSGFYGYFNRPWKSVSSSAIVV